MAGVWTLTGPCLILLIPMNKRSYCPKHLQIRKIFQFFSCMNSFCCCHKDIIGGQKEKNLCGNECQAGFHKLSHSIKMKDTMKKYTPPQGNINAHSQQDHKFGSFYTDISDIIEKAALTGIAKALSHGKGSRTRNWNFFSDMKKAFHFPRGLQKAVREHWLL